MVLTNLSNQELVTKAKFISAEERRLVSELLHYLVEIEKKRLFAMYGYSSMFEFVTKELGYSEASAHRRISAMRLMIDNPEIETKIKEGKVSLSGASKLYVFLQQEKKTNKVYSPIEKKELLTKIENKSIRDVEKIFKTISPVVELPKEKEKSLSPTKTQIQFNADQKLMEKLKKIRATLGRHTFNLTYEDMFNKMCDMVLEKLEKVEQKQKPKTTTSGESRYIPVSIKQEIIKRDDFQCTFISPITGVRCGAKTNLEFDHIHPFSLGGSSTLDNMRCLCKAHNQLEAITILGKDVMKPYLKDINGSY